MRYVGRQPLDCVGLMLSRCRYTLKMAVMPSRMSVAGGSASQATLQSRLQSLPTLSAILAVVRGAGTEGYAGADRQSDPGSCVTALGSKVVKDRFANDSALAVGDTPEQFFRLHHRAAEDLEGDRRESRDQAD